MTGGDVPEEQRNDLVRAVSEPLNVKGLLESVQSLESESSGLTQLVSTSSLADTKIVVPEDFLFPYQVVSLLPIGEQTF